MEIRAQSSKTLIFGSPFNSPPFVFESNGRGEELDIISSTLHKLGYSIRWRYLPPKRIRYQVSQHEINGGIRTLALPGDRLFYSKPYIVFHNVAISILPNVQLNSIHDLANYSVVAFQNAKEFLGPDYVKAVSSSSVYLELPNQLKQIETLFRNRAQVIVLEKRIFSYFREMLYPKSEVKIFNIFPPTHYSAVFHDRELRDEFDKALPAKPQQPLRNEWPSQ